MPVYAFECTECAADFSLLRTIAERAAPAECPECGASARRVVCAPNLAVMSSHQRFAATTNERSQHEPRVTHSGPAKPTVPVSKHRCGSLCGCGGKGVRKQKQKETAFGVANTTKPSARPWMLGH